MAQKFVFAQLTVDDYTLRIIDVSEEEACSKLLRLYRHIVEEEGRGWPLYDDPEDFCSKEDISISYLEIGIPECG